MKLKELEELYKNELNNQIIPFWIDNSLDNEYGGYLTCLDDVGDVYDYDKFIWLQCRQMWMFSYLYENQANNINYLEVAKLGESFLTKYGHDGNYDWFFSLDRKGNPLVQPYNIFSNTFAAMAYGRLGLITGDENLIDISRKTFQRILDREKNPKGKYNKLYPGTRPLKNFSLPMILCNLTIELGEIIDQSISEPLIERVTKVITEEFYSKEYGLVHENIHENGSFSDSYDGRLINPGHSIESMWFLMEIAEKQSNTELISKAVQITLNTLEFGWDKQYGGIFYFLDIKNKPLQQLEWNQKLWWVHIETLIALIKAYRLTGDKKCLEWFTIVHDYTWKNFRDSKNKGEWFGYLNRDGSRLLDLKGGKWKGCFHVPRGLYKISKILTDINATSQHEK